MADGSYYDTGFLLSTSIGLERLFSKADFLFKDRRYCILRCSFF